LACNTIFAIPDGLWTPACFLLPLYLSPFLPHLSVFCVVVLFFLFLPL